ncbi:hypothetical protein Acsp05_67150 [Actinokineospora sp. NBRC 105648]|nr:hypothetical protein Acsp05_67150 [Actinokineospora sp. NBRC 105648]
MTAASALVLVSCAQAGTRTDPGAGPGPTTQIGPTPDGRTFTASVAAPRALVAGTTLTIGFAEGALVANAGCNTISGRVDLTGGTLDVGSLATTEMGCDQPRHDQDAWLVGFLEAKPAWKLDGEQLTLAKTTTSIVLAEQRTAPLEGARWTVDSLTDGPTASSPPGTATASLSFSADTVAIETGCNSGSAPYKKNGQTLVIEAPILTRMACADDRGVLESAVVAVVEGEVAYSIEGRALTLTKGAKSLILRLEP